MKTEEERGIANLRVYQHAVAADEWETAELIRSAYHAYSYKSKIDYLERAKAKTEDDHIKKQLKGLIKYLTIRLEG